MASSKDMLDFVLDQLAELPGVRARKMFGEYALYCDDKVVALLCDNQLFVKITAEGKALVGEACREGAAYPGAKPSIVVGAEELEDRDRLVELVRVTAAALPKRGASARPKKAGAASPKKKPSGKK